MSASPVPGVASPQSHYERPSTRKGPYKDRVVVFVHGIFGDADSTWRYSPTVYWPRLLLADETFEGSDVYVANYSSPYFGNTMNLDEVVTNLNNRFVSDQVFSKHREVVFVCHSLGGLVVQRLLETFRQYAAQVPFIYFFSTPETGAQIANLASVFSSDPLLKALIPGDENAYLQNLENEWKAAHFQIHRFCAYEKKKYKGVFVVDRLSSTRNCDDPPLAINEDHISIVKPDSVNHDSYVALQNAFRLYPVGKPVAQTAHTEAQPPLQRTIKFAVMIPFDTAPNSLPIPMDENPDDPLFSTYAELQSIAMNGTIPQATRETHDNGQLSSQMRTISMEEAPSFLSTVLQYYVFHRIDNLQHNSVTSYVGYPSEANAGIEPPDAEVYPYSKIHNELADNVFFRPFLYRPVGDDATWKVMPSKMPKGIEIKFITQKPDKYLVRFQRPTYFTADFIVQQFLGTGVGQLPKHFASKNAATIMQWAFVVTMHYEIKHPEDKAFDPANYSQWLDALYDGLRRKLETDQSEKRSR